MCLYAIEDCHDVPASSFAGHMVSASFAAVNDVGARIFAKACKARFAGAWHLRYAV
jgi:hypothetical protein